MNGHTRPVGLKTLGENSELLGRKEFGRLALRRASGLLSKDPEKYIKKCKEVLGTECREIRA